MCDRADGNLQPLDDECRWLNLTALRERTGKRNSGCVWAAVTSWGTVHLHLHVPLGLQLGLVERRTRMRYTALNR